MMNNACSVDPGNVCNLVRAKFRTMLGELLQDQPGFSIYSFRWLKRCDLRFKLGYHFLCATQLTAKLAVLDFQARLRWQRREPLLDEFGAGDDGIVGHCDLYSHQRYRPAAPAGGATGASAAGVSLAGVGSGGLFGQLLPYFARMSARSLSVSILAGSSFTNHS